MDRNERLEKPCEEQEEAFLREVQQAKAYCLRLLVSVDRTESQLRTKMRQKGYSEQAADEVISYVKGLHYLDDGRYASYYIAAKSGTKSKRQIIQDLQRRGVSRETIERQMEEADEIDELPVIRRWMEKKHFDPQQADEKETWKFCQFLQRKGFSSSDIRRVLRGFDMD